VYTAFAHNVSGGGVVVAPLGGQHVAGQWVQDIQKGDPQNINNVSPMGSLKIIDGFTDPTSALLLENNTRMPASWNFQFQNPGGCIDQDSGQYEPLPSTYNVGVALNPTIGSYAVTFGTKKSDWNITPQSTQNVLEFNCFDNTPANPDFVPSDVNPQFVLDDQLPATIQVHAFAPINAASSITSLHLYSTSFSNPANVTAQSVASDGSSAVFPYPKAANGAALPAGAYITTITTDPAGGNQTTNGMEPIYIAHDDTSFPSAFGVDIAIPSETIQTITWLPGNQHGPCAGGATSSTSQYGGSSLPLVTLPALGQLAVGSASRTISVGANPTVVLAYNSQTMGSTQYGPCGPTSVVSYSGAQSALVVNTGSNSVSLVNIGQYNYPTGTISVGTSPVAAAINPTGTLAYIANWGSGTLSEINLSNVQVTRTLNVMAHPTSVVFDSAGNLFVGGQGSVQSVNLSNWSVSNTIPIDGTVTGMSYDQSQNGFISTVLRNGTISSPSNGKTMSAAIAYNRGGGVSYSATSLVNAATGSTSTSTISADSAPYAQSSGSLCPIKCSRLSCISRANCLQSSGLHLLKRGPVCIRKRHDLYRCCSVNWESSDRRHDPVSDPWSEAYLNHALPHDAREQLAGNGPVITSVIRTQAGCAKVHPAYLSKRYEI
jgi:YVTN family beta-propeller protein